MEGDDEPRRVFSSSRVITPTITYDGVSSDQAPIIFTTGYDASKEEVEEDRIPLEQKIDRLARRKSDLMSIHIHHHHRSDHNYFLLHSDSVFLTLISYFIFL
ncbi:hypothetical protein LINGRAHAP2_LOCUS4831 [Linum grandiflorum]